MIAWFLAAPAASAAPLNVWGTAQPPGTAGVVLWMYGAQSGWVAPAIYAGVGFRRWDLWGAVGVEGDGDEPYDLVLQASPRWFPVEWLGVGTHVSYTVGSPEVIAGLDLVQASYAGRFAFSSNVSWQPRLGGDGVSPGEIWVLAGPELYLLPFLSVVGEVDAIFPAADPAGVQIAVTPALSFLLDREGTQAAAIGVVIPVHPSRVPPAEWTLGGYVGVSLDLRRPTAE